MSWRRLLNGCSDETKRGRHKVKGWGVFFFGALLGILPAQGDAQGCWACRDATAGSAPQVRAGLRRGIVALVVPAGGILVAVYMIARKIEKQREPEDWAS